MLKSTENKVSNQFQPKGKAKLINYSILNPHGGGLRLVLNQMNMVGKAESPLYKLFDRKWPQVKAETRAAYQNKNGFYKLGTVGCNVAVQSDVWVLGLLFQDEKLQTNTDALQQCLKQVCKIAKEEKAAVAISTLLTESTPEFINLINSELIDQGISVDYYQEPTT